MIDIKLIRENPKLVEQNIKRKGQNEKLVLLDKVIKLDESIPYADLIKEDLKEKANGSTPSY